MEITIFFTFVLLSFGLGFFFGVYFAPIKKTEPIKWKEVKSAVETRIKGKYKCYSPQTDPVKLFYNKEYSYFDESETKDL